MNRLLYISSCESSEKGGGIYAYELTSKGTLHQTAHLPVDCPMYTVQSERSLYVIQSEDFGTESRAFSVSLSRDGRFETVENAVSTRGEIACHLAVADEDIYIANYWTGSIARLPNKVVSYADGSHTFPKRQDSSHPHCIVLSPDKKYVLVADLGMDRIHVLDRELRSVSEASVPNGAGARHMVFSHDGAYLYCVNEMAASVSVFAWNGDSATLNLLNTFGDEILNLQNDHSAAAIRLSRDGKMIYISKRKKQTISVFETEDGIHFLPVQQVFCEGKEPRDFLLTPQEDFLVCANQNSNEVIVFAMQNGLISSVVDRVSLPAPLCVTLFRNEETV